MARLLKKERKIRLTVRPRIEHRSSKTFSKIWTFALISKSFLIYVCCMCLLYMCVYAYIHLYVKLISFSLSLCLSLSNHKLLQCIFLSSKISASFAMMIVADVTIFLLFLALIVYASIYLYNNKILNVESIPVFFFSLRESKAIRPSWKWLDYILIVSWQFSWIASKIEGKFLKLWTVLCMYVCKFVRWLHFKHFFISSL